MTYLATAVPHSWDGVPPAQAGPLGLVVILILAVACVFLFRSMTKQLRKIPDSFDPPDDVTPDEVTPDDVTPDDVTPEAR